MVFFSLGTNLGRRTGNLRRAIRLIQERIGTVVSQSAFIDTLPWGFESSHRFLNACVGVETSLSPREVLQATQDIEREMGRKRKSTDGNYHDRLIDIDILLYDDLVIDEPDLQIPHPFMAERMFVLKPLAQIARNQAVPGTGKSVGEMLRALEARS